jgi:spore maturation protein CgeB
MIDEKILFLTHTDCGIPELKKHGLGIGPNLDLDAFFVQPLKEIFSKVIVYDMWKSYAEIGVRKSNKEIIDIVRSEQPKYLLWHSMMYEIMESTFQEIREQGTLVVGWFFDDEIRFDNYSKWWIPFLDYCLTNDKEGVGKYEKLGIHAKHMVLGGNPNIFKTVDVNLIYDVTFVGRNFGQKEIWINNMAANGIVVQTFGRGWTSGYVATEEMIKLFNASKINLNFAESYGRNTRPQIKNRIFEVCMAGGFLLSEYVPGIEEYFEIDKEIACFKNIDEANDKIQYYLAHEDERKAIARAGWERAQSDYTQTAKLIKAFEEIHEASNCRKHEIKDNREILNMPPHIRQFPSSYHLSWAGGLMIEKFPDTRWQEELELALFYDPFNKEAHQLRLIGRLPASLRSILLYCRPAYIKLKQLLLSYLASIPMLRKIKRALIS